MNWLDLGIIILLVIFIIIGVKQGFMNSILSNFSLGVNCLLSFFLCKPIKFILDKVFHVGAKIFNSYYTSFTAIDSFNVDLMTVSSENLHSTVNIAINEGNFNFFSKTMFKIFLNKRNLYDTLHTSEHVTRTMADIVPQVYANFYLTIISFVIALVLIFITVKLFQLLAIKLRTIGFVKTVDNVFGALYSVFRCFIVLVILSVVIKFLSGMSFMSSVVNYVNGSLIGRFIYSQINEFLNNYLSFSDIVASIFRH